MFARLTGTLPGIFENICRRAYRASNSGRKGAGRAICRWRKRHEPFKALCYPWQAPEGHSYLPAAVCFADLNRVTFAARNGPGEFLHRPAERRERARKEGRKEGRTSSEITGAKCVREKMGEEEEEG